MNKSSKFVNENSGVSNSNEIKSNFSFNSPSIPLPGSGLTKPRIAKTRRQTGTNNPRTSSLSVPDVMVNPSFNPFKPNQSNFDSVPSRAEIGEKNGAFTFGVNIGVSNANLSNESSENAVKDVIFEMGELNIGIGVNRSDSNVGSSGNTVTDMIDKLGGLNIASEASFANAQNRGFVFKGVGQKSVGSDEIKVSNDMSRLNTGHLGSDEYNRDNKDAPGARIGGINDNAASSFRKSMESEFLIEFNKSNVKGTPVSSETLLPDHMSNLNLKDTVNLNRVEKNVGYKNTSHDSKFIYGNGTIRSGNMGDGTDKLLLDKMGNMKIESVEGDSSIQPDTDFTSHKIFMNKQKTGNLNDKMFQNMGESVPTGFTFNTAMHVKSSESISEIPLINIPGKNDEFPFTTAEAPHVVFNTPNSKGNLFSNLNQKPEFTARRVTDNNRSKKGREKLNKQHDPVQVWLGPNPVTGESSFQENSLLPAPYSPMDVSPYEETLANNRSGKSYVGSDDCFRVDESNNSLSTVSNDAMDEDLALATQQMNISEINEKSEVKEREYSRSVSTENDIKESMSGAETESFVTAVEELDCSSESFESEVNSRSNDSVQFFSTNSQVGVGVGENFIFGSSSSAQGQASAVARQYRKKNRPKIGTDLSSSTIPSGSVLYASSNVQFPFSEPLSLSSPRHSQTADTPALQRRGGKEFEFNKEQQHKLVTTSTSDASVAAQEACEKWRLRGNQSYSNGDLTKAEGLYTLGVNCVSQNETSRSCLSALTLCYSNRAATRMALGRFKQAIEDCKLAAVIDPNFLKVQLRSANCYLALGEVAEALQYFRKCLQPGTEICVDQKTMIEASEGLQKTQKVSEYLNQSTELIRRRTTVDTESALSIIAEALLISTHSEILLEMKAEALFKLRKYEEVLQLCEESLDLAKVDFPSLGGDDQSANPDSSALLKNFSSKPWRFNLILKSYFYLGKLEEALDILEKWDGLRNGNMTLESSIPLAVIQELLSHKAAGNDAFQSGRHAEAIEHYTAALSCSVESRPFAAICFCNRGAANKSLGQITDAIADCSLAIALDRKYLKALSRRASLYETIRDYGQAANDLQRLVSILVEQVEAKTNQSVVSYRSASSANDLREAQFRLSEMEGESRKEIPLNMYLILGIEPSVSASEIKKAYRKAALRHHPDKAVQSLARSDNGDEWLWKEIAEEVHKDADRLFKMIGEAYAVLSNPSKRSRYDLEEEMRTARSNVSRTHADTQNYPFDPRSTSRRHWTEVQKSYWHP